MTPSLGVRCGAELLGTALLVGIGTGAIVLGASVGGVPQWVLAIAWFAAVAVPVEAFAYVSGSHVNPAVTLTLAGSGRFPKEETLPYLGAQFGGGFVGSLIVRAVLGSGAHLGATLPGPEGPVWVVPLEFGFTSLLLLTVFYLVDRKPRPGRITLLLPAAVVGLSTYLIGPWTGSSLNPARSLAPALLSGDLAWYWLYLGATLLSAGAMAGLAHRYLRDPGAATAVG